MNGYERMMAALRLEQPDRVPVWELIINSPVIRALHGDISYADFVEKEDLDGITVLEDQKTQMISSDTFRDEWGIVWRKEPSGLDYPIDGPIKSEKDLDKYRPPDADAPWRLQTLTEYVKRFKREKAIVFLGHDAFEFSHYLLGGMDKLFFYYISNPDFVHRLAQMVIEYKCQVMQNAVDAGADILLTGDDYAGRKGTFMSPQHFREFILPYLKMAVDVAKKNRVPFIKHTDGNLWQILDDLVTSGIDALDPVEPIARMDIGQIKKKYGDRICLIGNVDCTEILTHATTSEVEEAVKETVAKASPGGGHILASSNSIHPAVKPENYKKMIEVARKWGTYPLDTKMVEEYRNKNYITTYLDKYPV